MNEQFVSESIQPMAGTAVADRMAIGEPGLPPEFFWRGKKYSVETVLKQWKELAPCTHGSGEKYVRKHWFKFATASDSIMTVYFERQPRRGNNPKSRWWLFKISIPSEVD
ncbi:MAG: DUF6504 family protein [candidate division Zixibacteria bacterium]|nr:DUF6504 family protein [candidate division Zixibacteria bacterium]